MTLLSSLFGTANQVTAGANLTDHCLVRGDGGAKGIQTTGITVDDNGIMNNSLQPLFLAYISTTQSNVTGDNTAYNVVGDFWTEITDQNADFSQGTFTAPVTGTYIFSSNFRIEDIAADATYFLGMLITSNRNYTLFYIDVSNVKASDNLVISFAMPADMDAADTAYLRITIYGTSKSVDIPADLLYFGGYLIA